jgi:type VI protein secretion system component VasK
VRNSFHDKDQPHNFTSMTQVRFFIAVGLATLVLFGVLVGLILYVPSVTGFTRVLVSGLAGIATLLIALKRLLRHEPVSQKAKDADMRDQLTAERQKQVDDMRRANSNIPEVKRERR